MTPVNIEVRSDVLVDYITHCGGDWLITDAARNSTVRKGHGAGIRNATEADRKLLSDLTEFRHGGPFGHGSLSVYVEAPIFVMREARTHKIVLPQSESAEEGWANYTPIITDDKSYSEASARYRPLKPVFWVPQKSRPFIKAEGFKAMRPEFVPADGETYSITIADLAHSYQSVWESFQSMLDLGIAPEVARTILPVGIYSSMYVSGNPLSWMRFMSLRIDSPGNKFKTYPQKEIQMLALQIEDLFQRHWPETHEAWDTHGRIAF